MSDIREAIERLRVKTYWPAGDRAYAGDDDREVKVCIGDIRLLLAALPPATSEIGAEKPWHETDAHRDLSRIIPDMERKIAEAKVKFAHCLPPHLFAPLEASITELRVLRHELAAPPVPASPDMVLVPRVPTEAMLSAARPVPAALNLGAGRRRGL